MFFENVRCAYRNLRSAPGFTLTAILSLGIAIGGTLAMFTLVKSILLKPLAYPDPDRLVLIMQTAPDQPSYGSRFAIAPIEFLRWRDEIRSVESMGVMVKAAVNLTGFDRPETLGAVRISAGLFETLGVKPLQGRWFTWDDEKRDMPNVAIISAHLWRQQFSSDPKIIGRKIILDGAHHEIVGVTRPDMRFFRARQLHPGFDLPEQTDVFLPVRFSVAEEQGRPVVGYLLFARLKPGVTPAQASAELDHSLRRIEFNPPVTGSVHWWTVIQPLHTALVGDIGTVLWLLLFAVGFMLLIACVNVANLSLMHAARRSRELAIRVAVGATRYDLIAYSFAESLLLALTGTAVGLFLSVWMTDTAVALAPSRIPRLDETTIDGSVFLCAVATCVLTTILFGVLPAWRASQADPQEALSATGPGKTETRRGRRIRTVLVTAEVSLGTLLAIGSGLLLVSLQQVMNARTGFTADPVVIADFALPPAKYQSVEARERFFRGLRDQLTTKPGVVAIAAATSVPLDPERIAPVVTEDSAAGSLPRLATWRAVSSEYLGAMDIPLREGRFFRERETEAVVVVSAATAHMLWPGQHPIGKRVSRDEKHRSWLRVIGVAGDVLSAGLDRPSTPAIYWPFSQYGTAAFSVVIRTADISDGFRASLRRAVAQIDPEIPVREIRTISESIGRSTQQRRFQTALFTAFALIAVLLAAIGVYGVVAYSLVQRRREIGLRIALGADPRDVIHLVFRSGMSPVLVGLVVGVGMATLLGQAMASLLFNVSTRDPITFLLSPLVLVLAGAVPCGLIARRALRIDPGVCLRVE
jgi:putative ABC transport system permease protein